jgi:hypothetical protein
MLIETDSVYAFVKSSDSLKPVADKLMWRIKEGELGGGLCVAGGVS